MTSVEDLARTIRDAANAGLRVAQGTVVEVVDTTHVSVDLGDRVITAYRPGSVPAGEGAVGTCARRVWCRGGRLVHGWRVILGRGAAVLDGCRNRHPLVLRRPRVSVRHLPRGPVHATPGGDRDIGCRQSRHLPISHIGYGDRLHHRRIVVLHRLGPGAVGRGPDDLHIRHRLTHLLLPALSLSWKGIPYACPPYPPRSARRRCPHCPARGRGCPDPGPWPRSRPEPRVAADVHDPIIGTTGKALRLEAVKLSGFPVEYQAHVQNIGWLPWVDAGEQAGTTGKSLRMEAIRIRLVPTAAMFGSVEYRCHVQNLGWLAWTRDGGTCGTTGKSLRMEALQVRFVGAPTPPLSPPPDASPPPRRPSTDRDGHPDADRHHARTHRVDLDRVTADTGMGASGAAVLSSIGESDVAWVGAPRGHGLPVRRGHRAAVVRLREGSCVTALPARAGEP
jgi:hypothetical protein